MTSFSERQQALCDALATRILVLDGAMGTMLQQRELTTEDRGGAVLQDCPEYLVKCRPDVISDIHKAYLAAGSDIIETNSFNATPIGMTGFPGNPVPVESLRPDHWVADVIYSPMHTELIKAAAAKGARTLTGGGMCVYQAVDAFRLFTGIDPDVARMHRTFDAALAARDALS